MAKTWYPANFVAKSARFSLQARGAQLLAQSRKTATAIAWRTCPTLPGRADFEETEQRITTTKLYSILAVFSRSEIQQESHISCLFPVTLKEENRSGTRNLQGSITCETLGGSDLDPRNSRFSPAADLAEKNPYSSFRRNMIKQPRNLFLYPNGCFSGFLRFLRFLHGPGYYPAQEIFGLQTRPRELFMAWCSAYPVPLRVSSFPHRLALTRKNPGVSLSKWLLCIRFRFEGSPSALF